MRVRIQLYDIDKLNIYWTNDIEDRIFSNKQSESLDNQLLNIEKEILLHPNNIHHLLMPLGSDIFVNNLYWGFFQANKLVAKENENFFNILSPITNAKKAVIFVQGKFAVGIGALSITFSAVNQANSVIGNSINDEYIIGQIGDKTLTKTTTLRFAETLGKNFSHYTDNQMNTFSKVMSELLTLYVDGVKEPYAVLMNITLQTANVVDYMIKNGLPASVITKFLSQPLIKNYLIEQKINESIYNKNAEEEITDKKEFIEFVLRKNNNPIEVDKSDGLRVGFTNIPGDVLFNEKSLTSDLLLDEQAKKSIDFKVRQAYYLQHFLELQDLSSKYGEFLKTQNSDTKGFADSQDIISDNNTYNNVLRTKLVPFDVKTYHDTKGIISPFYKYGRTLYNELYGNYYMFSLNKPISDQINNIKLALAKGEKGGMKERLMSTFDNDFILFLVHNLYFNKDSFSNLLTKDSVAKKVADAKKKYPSNIFLNMLQPEIGSKQNNLKVDLLKLYEKKLDGYATNDISKAFEELYEIDSELYTNIIHSLYFQNGFNQGLYNFFNVVPEGKSELRNEDNLYKYITQDIMTTVLDQYNKLGYDEQSTMLEKFRYMFDLNNPRFVKTRYNSHMVRQGTGTDSNGNEIKVFKIQKIVNEKKKELTVPLLGNSNIKNYHLSNFTLLNELVEKQTVKQQPVVDNSNVETNQSTQSGIDKSLDNC